MNTSKLFQIVVLYSTFGLGGCGHDAHGHDHDNDHDHGPAAHKPDYDGGFIVEAKDHFATIELVPQFDDARLHLYLFDGCADEAVRSGMEQVTIDLELADGPIEVVARAQADVLSGETVGDTSQFLVEDERLQDLGHVKGSIRSITFLGQTYTGVAFDTDPATHEEGYYGGRSEHVAQVASRKGGHDGHDGHEDGHDG